MPLRSEWTPGIRPTRSDRRSRPGIRSCSPISSMPGCCASFAIAASESATSCATKSVTPRDCPPTESSRRASPGARSAHIKAPLTSARHGRGMVTRKRLRAVLNALALYVIAALVIGYFGVNAYSGNHGLRAKQDLDQQIAELSDELGRLKSERAGWERRVLLLKPESIDPDMLDERARVLLNYADPRELTLRRKQP